MRRPGHLAVDPLSTCLGPHRLIRLCLPFRSLRSRVCTWAERFLWPVGSKTRLRAFRLYSSLARPAGQAGSSLRGTRFNRSRKARQHER
jgi:hypothetical protein